MKKPYLARYVETHNFVKETRFVYDPISQLSYLSIDQSIKVIDKIGRGVSSMHTFSDEDSDPDEMNFATTGMSGLTETIEDSDPDELQAVGVTYFTRAIEDSDPDECLLGESTFTKSIESSDPDDMHMADSTVITATEENTDPDEITCLL